MKQLIRTIAIVVILFATLSANAQVVEYVKGDLDILKNETTVNVEIAYDKMGVGDYSKEEAFIKNKKEEYNKKEAGSGDTWATKWESDKLDIFPAKFEQGLKKEWGITASKDAKYTIIFTPKNLEPGYQVGIAKKNASITGKITVVETANRTKVVAAFSVDEAPDSKWRGAAFDATSRIGDTFYLTGVKTGKLIKKGTPKD